MHARGSGAALRRFAAGAIVAAWAAGSAAALAAPGDERGVTTAGYQATGDDLDGEARVTVEIAPVRRETEIAIDVSGGTASEVAVADVDTGGNRGEVVEIPPSAAVEPITPTAPMTTIDEPAAAAQEVPAAAPVAGGEADGEAIDLGDVSTGGEQGATVIIGDTIGGTGEPGAPGGDAIVEISVGPIGDGTATAGAATPGEVSLLDPGSVAAPLDQDPTEDVLIDASSADDPATAARLGLFAILGVLPDDDGAPGPAIGGSATSGSAVRGEASVVVVVGDTLGGDGRDGRAGGDAIVLLDVGPVTGGDATGGAATGGDAIQGSGAAVGGDAVGGAARGGDAEVLIGVGDTLGVDGDGARPGDEAAVTVSIGSVDGGAATGGAATGGEAWGLAGIAAEGGDAAGGATTGGTAFVEIRVGDLEGGKYRADVDRIGGGDATGGTATGGDAIDLKRER